MFDIFNMILTSSVIGGGDIGGGINYSNIKYNNDDTITLIDKDGTEHIIECKYSDGKLSNIKYDSKTIKLSYDDETLKSVGNTRVDISSLFSSGRSEITYDTIDDLIGEGVRTSVNNGKVIKSYEGISICGYTKDNASNAGYYYVVAETKHGCIATNLEYKGTVDYEGKTYHYSKSSYLANINYNGSSTLRCWFIGETITYNSEQAVTRLLDYYYRKIDE